MFNIPRAQLTPQKLIAKFLYVFDNNPQRFLTQGDIILNDAGKQIKNSSVKRSLQYILKTRESGKAPFRITPGTKFIVLLPPERPGPSCSATDEEITQKLLTDF